jgi:hypothetical protein
MLDPRKDTIIYQAQVYYSDLVNKLVSTKKLGKANDSKWIKAAKIRQLLKAMKYVDRLTSQVDIDNSNYILECLIQLCQLNSFPINSPLNYNSAPSIIFGEKGDKGDKGDTGAKGDTGLATDFQAILVSVPATVDSFPISDANGARWDYFVQKNTGESRTGSVLAVWDSAGTVTQFSDNSTDDIVGPTTQLEFSVQFFGTSVLLVALVTGGTWTIRGSRYFIPNNGNGTGPISDSLPNGQVYIGNGSNLAQARTLSGAFTITNTGVATLSNSIVSDANVNASANIAVSKLASLTVSSLVVSDGAGKLTTISSPTLTELGFVGGVSSSIQTQLNSKLTDPLTTVGDLLTRNSFNVTSRLGIGSNGQVLTVSGGLVSWQTPSGGITGLTAGRVPIAASSTTLTDNTNLTFSGGNTLNVPNINYSAGPLTLSGNPGVVITGNLQVNNGIRTNTGGDYWHVVLLNIGDWDMDTNATKTVSHGLTFANIRSVKVLIRNDANNTWYDIYSQGGGTIFSVDSSIVTLTRASSGIFDNTNFDVTGYNRGYIEITYVH